MKTIIILILNILFVAGCSTTKAEFKEEVYLPNRGGIVRISKGRIDQELGKKKAEALIQKFCKDENPEITKIVYGEKVLGFFSLYPGYSFTASTPNDSAIQDVYFECKH